MSPKKTIPLFDLKLSREAIKQATQTLESGWLTSGPKVKQFEFEVAEYLAMKYSSAVNSCTAGLQIVLSALGVAGKKVVTTPFTFVGTISAILHAGGIPVLADIDTKSLNIDPEQVALKVTKDTAAIVPVDIAGNPCDYARLGEISERFSVPLISDSAHAIGAEYKNQSLPHFTDASVFSFYSTKNLTCGEGGMVVSRHEALIETVNQLRQHGLTRSTSERSESVSWQYDVAHLGFKANLSDLHAAVGLGQLKSLERNQLERKRLAETYAAQLSDLADFIQFPMAIDEASHGWHLFIIQLHLSRLSIDRNRFIELMAEAGIECGVHYQPIFELSFFRKALLLNGADFPNATRVGKQIVTLPLYPGLSKIDQDFIVETIRRILQENTK